MSAWWVGSVAIAHAASLIKPAILVPYRVHGHINDCNVSLVHAWI